MKIATLIVLALMIMLPAVPSLSEPPQRDAPAELLSAKKQLEGARYNLNHAGSEWGGHRVAATKHIDEALSELEQAEQWAREHHDVK